MEDYSNWRHSWLDQVNYRRYVLILHFVNKVTILGQIIIVFNNPFLTPDSTIGWLHYFSCALIVISLIITSSNHSDLLRVSKFKLKRNKVFPFTLSRVSPSREKIQAMPSN